MSVLVTGATGMFGSGVVTPDFPCLALAMIDVSCGRSTFGTGSPSVYVGRWGHIV